MPRLHRRSALLGTLIAVVISLPVSLWEEQWHGSGMISGGGMKWLVPAVYVGLALGIGGALAGRHRRRAEGALLQGAVVAVVTWAVLLLADLARRLGKGIGFPLHVVGLWVLVLVGATIICLAGALIGRAMYLRGQPA